MRIFLIFILSLSYFFSYSQNKKENTCKVEFYLLKNIIPQSDTINNLGAFSATPNDLEKNPFIKDYEIASYSRVSNSIKTDSTNAITERFIFKVPDSVTKRVNSLNLPPCCGRQFALLINGKICFTGYFWNRLFLFSYDSPSVIAYDSSIDIIVNPISKYSSTDNPVSLLDYLLTDCFNSRKKF